MSEIFNKLALVVANFVLVTKASKKNNVTLVKVLCIYYLLRFYKNKKTKI